MWPYVKIEILFNYTPHIMEKAQITTTAQLYSTDYIFQEMLLTL